jgi:hypothetical protein
MSGDSQLRGRWEVVAPAGHCGRTGVPHHSRAVASGWGREVQLPRLWG